jgi:Uma2 family endonuclease
MADPFHSEIEGSTVRLRLRPVVELTEDAFFDLCQLNRKLRLERTAQGEILIMPPSGGETGASSAKITARLEAWAEKDGSGIVFDSSTGFTLPDGATRSPDAAWVSRSRLAALTREQKKRFLPLSPDFVVELRSPSDRLVSQQEKMEEYIANGTRLGWLIDTAEQRVHVYRADADVECIEKPAMLSGDPVLPGFTLDLSPVWDPGF